MDASGRARHPQGHRDWEVAVNDDNSITTHADMKLSIRPAAPPPPIISIMANDYRPLLTIHPDGTVTGEIENASEAARVFVDHIRKYIGEPQTDARVADLLFKLDVAATTFEKVTTSEHREAVFNAEHAKMLRDTIKALRQPQTDALKMAREIPAAALDALRNGQKQIDADGEMVGVSRQALDEVLAALKESK
jgi:hypothetical protein